MLRWRAIIRSYSGIRKLSRQEKVLLPAFVVIRESGLPGFHLMMCGHVGDAWLDDCYYDNHLRFIRGWVR